MPITPKNTALKLNDNFKLIKLFVCNFKIVL